MDPNEISRAMFLQELDAAKAADARYLRLKRRIINWAWVPVALVIVALVAAIVLRLE